MKSSAAAWLLLCGLLTACAPKAPAAQAGPEGSCTGVAAATRMLPGARSLVYATPKDRPLRLHVIPPTTGEGPRPAILLFFGGGWREGDVTRLEPQARAFAANGYVAVLADYRVRCRDGSSPLDSTKDAQAAYAWLRAHAAGFNVDPHRIVLGGGSAGGQLALATAQKAEPGEKPAALILFNPAVDLVTPAKLWQNPFAWGISPSKLPVEGLPPTAIFHGEADAVVPIATARAFCDRAWKTGAVCVVRGYPGQGHGFYRSHAAGPGGAPSPYDDTLARALDFLQRAAITDPGRRPSN